MRNTNICRRPGFALIELIVALTLAAVVALIARAMFEHVADGAHELSRQAEERNSDVSGWATVRDVVGRTESASSVSGSLRGDSDAVNLVTWCDVPPGWQEQCEVVIGFSVEDSATILRLLMNGRQTTIASGFAYGRLLYLPEIASEPAWNSQWVSQITTPIALGIVIDADTTILRIGRRG